MKKWLRITVITILPLLVLIPIIALNWSGVGFQGKTLWDRLNLLGVLAIPIVVGWGTVWYTTQQTKVSEAVTEQQHKTELELAEQRYKTELEIAANNQREAMLQAYIDKMSELLLEKNLRQSGEQDEVRDVARVRTLTILRRLDPIRRTSVLQFLIEAHLWGNDHHLISLNGADLGGVVLDCVKLNKANLVGANLSGSNLFAVDLSGADLHFADLRKANLLWSTLRGTDLHSTDLSEASLWSANLRKADLTTADLSGANLNYAKLNESKGITDEQLNKASLSNVCICLMDRCILKEKEEQFPDIP